MDLLHQLIKSQPFIYLIGENYYLISNAIFQECSGEDITFAKKFVDEVNGVISLHNHRILQQRDVEDFNRLYDEIKKREVPSAQTPKEVAYNLEKFLLRLKKENPNEIESIQKQRLNLVTLLDLQMDIAYVGNAEIKRE